MAVDTQTLIILGISMAGPILGSLAGVSFRPKEKLLLAMLSFAGGTMLAISFLQLIPESIAMCGPVPCGVGILIGLLAMLLLGQVTPHSQTPVPQAPGPASPARLKDASVMMIAAIFLHNFPEGIAMASAQRMPTPGKALLIAVALATHDIPEGICTSAPYYYATGRRLRAFLLSAGTAIPVLVGFFLGRFIFRDISGFAMGIIVGAVAGLMIYVSCEELIPTSQAGESPRFSMAALMLGILFVMALGAVQP